MEVKACLMKSPTSMLTRVTRLAGWARRILHVHGHSFSPCPSQSSSKNSPTTRHDLPRLLIRLFERESRVSNRRRYTGNFLQSPT